MRSRNSPEPVSSLSSREIEIAGLYAQGRTCRQIAAKLCISPTTVRNHVAAIYRKLEVRNKTELGNLLSESGETGRASGTPTRGDALPARESGVSATERELANMRAQQRATGEVLQVISHSPGDIDSIFDVILDYALQLSRSQLGIVYLCIDGGFQAAVFKNLPPAFEEYLSSGKIYPGPGTGLGRMFRQHRIIHIPDVRSENLYREGDPLRLATVDLGGARSFLAIPMIHRADLIGAFTIYRQEVKPFSDEELSLLQAFSDQAAIALTITRLIDDKERLLRKLEGRR